jgi:hypothetical protein
VPATLSPEEEAVAALCSRDPGPGTTPLQTLVSLGVTVAKLVALTAPPRSS